MNITALSYGERYIFETSDTIKKTNKGKQPSLFYDDEDRTRKTRLIPFRETPVKNSYLYPNIKVSMKPYNEKLVAKSQIVDSIKQTKRETQNGLPSLKNYWF
jgi:hypothetical protein